MKTDDENAVLAAVSILGPDRANLAAITALLPELAPGIPTLLRKNLDRGVLKTGANLCLRLADPSAIAVPDPAVLSALLARRKEAEAGIRKINSDIRTLIVRANSPEQTRP